MRIAKYIDPAVFYDKASATPYIMSPYLACVNTLSAWPAPHRSHDAVLALENGNAQSDSDNESAEDDVPRGEVQHDKKSTPVKPIRYWSFQGFREDETGNTLSRKATREEMLSDLRPIDEHGREGSIRTQSTKFDEERMVTSEHPNHRVALTRLGSYGREPSLRKNSVIGKEPMLSAFPETHSDDEILSSSDDDNDSFHTAVEYIVENVVQPDGTIVPVKKKKKGLSVKKVRKSLHIPSAKTVQKNMRGLSIKRKDKGEKRSDLTNDGNSDGGRPSTETSTRKSIDLMRPFRFGHHDRSSQDKDSTSTSRRSVQVERKPAEKAAEMPSSRHSMTEERFFSSQNATPAPSSKDMEIGKNMGQLPRSATVPMRQSSSYDIAPPIPSGFHDIAHTTQDNQRANSTLSSPSFRTQPSSNSALSIEPIAAQSLHSIESNRTQAVDPQSRAQNNHNSVSVSSAMSDRQNLNSAHGNDRSSKTEHGASKKSQEKKRPETMEELLGPWRFADPTIEPIEDTAFIFGDTSHSVKDRRKYFAKSAENREDFEFDCDIVYCMSFFLPYMNFNTFDLKLGPLGANLHKYVDDQPVRYMARSAERPDEVFFMVEFSLE